MTARLPKGNAANTAVMAQKIRIATFGTPVLGEALAITCGSQPSTAITKGRRETYSSCALNSAHIETTPATASSAASHGPEIKRPIAGQPVSVLQTDGSFVTLKPASIGSK